MEIVRVYLGLDYHAESVRVCLMTDEGETLVNRNIPNDPVALVDLVRAREGVLVLGVAIEACSGAAEFAQKLIDLTEWTVRLAHAGAVNRLKNTPDKSDHTDAWHLANLLRVNYLPEVWLADETTRQYRRLVRHRQSLMADARDLKLRIRSLLKEERVEENCEQGAWTKRWRTWLAGVSLPEHSRWVLDRDLKRLDQLTQEIKEVDDRMEEATREDTTVQTLRQQPGVGVVTALLLRAVIGRFDRFRSGKQLSRYCGLTPRNASSGKRQSDGGLVAEGHDDLRAALIQLAKRLPRHESRWRELHARLRKTKPANVVSAAIANRWVRRLYHEFVPDLRRTGGPHQVE